MSVVISAQNSLSGCLCQNTMFLKKDVLLKCANLETCTYTSKLQGNSEIGWMLDQYAGFL